MVERTHAEACMRSGDFVEPVLLEKQIEGLRMRRGRSELICRLNASGRIELHRMKRQLATSLLDKIHTSAAPNPEDLREIWRHGERRHQRRVSGVVDAASGSPRCDKQFVWLRTILQPNSAAVLAMTNSLESGFLRSWVVIRQDERGKQGKHVEVIFGHIHACAKVSVRRRWLQAWSRGPRSGRTDTGFVI
ncbi:MAG TPA: hypothetical protein VHP33_32015 [Polyangiaceae bacterium]|nr:hypothetical protein [Polyangiaceae bacterium]